MLKIKQFIGDKKFYKTTFAIILPIMIQQLFLSIAGYVDSLMINGYGGASTAAYDGVSAANKIMFVLNFIWIGFAATASIFVAQYYGAKNKEKVRESLRLSILMAIGIGIISFVLIHFAGNSIVNAYVSDPQRRQFGYDYLSYIKWGTVITAVNLAFANAFRSIKKPNISLIASISGIVVNLFFNYCFIFGHLGFPEMAAAGAALATVISRVVELLVFLVVTIFSKNEYINKNLFKEFKIEKDLVKKYVKKGGPVVFNEIMWSMGIVIYALLYTYGNDVWYNAYSISQNISDLFFIIFAGLGSGSAIIIGASLGKSDFEQAKLDGKRLIGLSIILGLIMGILMIALGPLVISMFKTSPTTTKLVMSILIVTAIFLVVYSFNSVCFFILRAGGDSLRAFILDQLPTYLIGIPIAALFGLNASNWGLSLALIFALTHLGDMVKIFMSIYFVKKGYWLVNITLKEQHI